MFSLQNMPSASSMFSAYASMTGTMMLVRSMVNELLPYPVRTYLVSTLRYLFMARSSELTLVIEERNGMVCNEVYDASEIYLCTKVSPDAKRLKITKAPKEKNLTIRFEKGEKFVDCFQGIELSWRFVICTESENSNDPSNSRSTEKRYFELSFDVKHKEKVLESYLPFVLHKSKTIKDEEREVKLYTLGSRQYTGGRVLWESINLQHPSTFDTLAMDHEEKKSIMEDLDRFVRRKEFYKRVGKAWKRGYLLYGPPGTGKSSLIAAMANYLKFDVYDLQLANVMRDSELRNLLLATTNRSILVIEDIDCSVDLPDRQLQVNGRKFPDVQVTLSGLLNFIDGLWSSCGDERIIVFTTNHKEKLDPALLRPGRMDLHIHMSYCTPCGFKLLAANYLGIKDHVLFGEIEEAIRTTEVTPAEVAEQLMKSDEPEIALGGLIEFLRMKKKDNEEVQAKQAEQALVDKEKQSEQQDEGVKEKK